MFNKLKKQVEYLTNSDSHNLWLFDQMTTKIKELEENLRLVYEYLGVHKEVINEAVLVDDDECDCICDECLANEDNWEDTFEDLKKKSPKKK